MALLIFCWLLYVERIFFLRFYMGMYGRDGQLDAMVLVMILAKRAGKKGGLGDRDRNNIYIYMYMRVSINMGTPKWIVYNGNSIYKWMIWGTTI